MKLRRILFSILALVLVTCMLFTGFVGCDKSDDDDDSSEEGGGNECGGNEGGGNEGGGNGGGGTTPTKSDSEIFFEAKNNTFSSPAFEYNYQLKAQIKFVGAVNFSPANIGGYVQYNSGAGQTTYLHRKELSGALLFDSTTYIYNSGNNLIELNADESKDFSVTKSQPIASGYDFEDNSIGTILKSLTADNANVTKEGNTYNIALKTNFQQGTVLRALNYIDSDKILTVLNKYIEERFDISINITSTATVSNNKMEKFVFNASVNIKDVAEIGFEYTQTFLNIGSCSTIKLPTYENTYTSMADINSNLAPVLTAFDKAMDADTSRYDYSLKTGVDHGVSRSNPLGLAVNSTSAGYAQREIIDEVVFFHNRLELDSDYKNNDQYPDYIEDYERYRAKVNNADGDVYDVTDGVFKNTYVILEDYNNEAIDEYYMMIDRDWIDFDSVKIMRKTTDSDNETTYTLGLSNEAVKEILEYYNDHIRLDADLEFELDVYDIASDFEAKKALFEIVLDAEGNIIEIVIETKGFYTLDDGEQVKYSLKLEIEYDWEEVYTAPTDHDDIELN